jgi:hypothetical protein
MSRGGFSFVGGGETYPKTCGKPMWLDDRTCVLSVALEPEHEYWLSINSDKFTNFRSAGGEPAVPYPIAFKTGPAKPGANPLPPVVGPAAPAATPSRLTPEMNRATVANLKRAVDLDYSYRDLRKVNWDRLFSQATPALERTRAADEGQADFILIEGDTMMPLVRTAGRYIQIGGALYHPHPARDGACITFAPVNDVPTGTLRLDVPRAQLTVGGENGLLYLNVAEGKVSAPAGKYRLTIWKIEKADDSGTAWRAEGSVIPNEAAVFEVNEGKETRLAVGEPFVCKKGTDTAQDRGTHSMSLRLRGRLSPRPFVEGRSGGPNRQHCHIRVRRHHPRVRRQGREGQVPPGRGQGDEGRQGRRPARLLHAGRRARRQEVVASTFFLLTPGRGTLGRDFGLCKKWSGVSELTRPLEPGGSRLSLEPPAARVSVWPSNVQMQSPFFGYRRDHGMIPLYAGLLGHTNPFQGDPRTGGSAEATCAERHHPKVLAGLPFRAVPNHE